MGPIPHTRVHNLNDVSVRSGDYVLYWMHASHRVLENPALQYAIERSNRSHLPLIIYFGLWRDYPEANTRHFQFMLEGLTEVAGSLESMGIPFLLKIESPVEGILNLSKKAAVLVVDRGYLKIHRTWYQTITKHSRCPILQVEGNVIVPVEVASNKEEYSAATFRPKIWRYVNQYLHPITLSELENSTPIIEIQTLAGENVNTICSQLHVDRRIPPSKVYKGGISEAKRHFDRFLRDDIARFDNRNDPGNPIASHMSPYLHFGQVSPVTLAIKAFEVSGPGSEAFVEELITRRELAINFVHYNQNYDAYSCLPSWAQQTLTRHASDPRDYVYSIDELENGETHDIYWNAAQQEMVTTGKMQGYMRMYWGKKIIEWSSTPEEAFARALYLNNKYEIDGRDPNGYAGVAWCFGKHDRPWKERHIFGKVRYMNEKGLLRKFAMKQYIQYAHQIK